MYDSIDLEGCILKKTYTLLYNLHIAHRLVH